MGVLSSVGHQAIVSGLAMAVLASINVCLRFTAKNLTKSGVRAEDYWILVGLVGFWAYVGVLLWGMFDGADRAGPDNLVPLKHDELKILLIALRLDISLFGTAITLVKIAILCLYHRIFPVSLIKRGTLALGVICLLWWAAVVLGSVFSCILQSKISPHCINFNPFYLVVCIGELFIDVLIFCLPLREISGINMPLRDKIILLMTFLVGGLVCVASLLRIVRTYRPHRNEVSFLQCLVWNNVQLGTAIICGCLPTYRPLLLKFKFIVLFPVHPTSPPSVRLPVSFSYLPNIPRLRISFNPDKFGRDSQHDLV